MFRTFHIGNQERGFFYKFGSFFEYAKPGKHRFFDPFYQMKLSKISTKDPQLNHPDTSIFLKTEKIKEDLKIVEISDQERGLLFIDGRYQKIIGPGQYGFFQDLYKIEIEIMELKNPEFEHPKEEIILSKLNYYDFLHVCDVLENHVALMLHHGKYVKTLTPGRHIFWKGLGDLKFFQVRTGDQQLDVAGQEMMTKDKVTLRMNVHSTYQIANPVRTELESANSRDVLYREIQLVIRQEVASRKLDELLSEREKLAEAFLAGIKKRAEELGYLIKNMGLRDIILPGEMKTILNQVVEAEKKAQANIIRRREETAATRSLLNTAKLMENNPVLMRLKEFEVLTDVSANIEGIQVVGGLGALLNQLTMADSSKTINAEKA